MFFQELIFLLKKQKQNFTFNYPLGTVHIHYDEVRENTIELLLGLNKIFDTKNDGHILDDL